MSRARHKIPTGLTVEDRLFSYGAISLTTRQFLLLLGGAAIGYGGVWQGWSTCPPCRAPASPSSALPSPPSSRWRAPDGRPLESWAFVLLRHWSRPSVAVWRPRPPRPDDWRPVGPDWAEVPATGGATGTADAHGGRGDAAAGAGVPR